MLTLSRSRALPVRFAILSRSFGPAYTSSVHSTGAPKRKAEGLGAVQKGTGEKPTVGADSFQVKAALNAPKRKAEGTGKLQYGKDAREAKDLVRHSDQAQSGGDQSVESQPEASTITYEEVGGDQSVETQPEASTITYDEVGGDQSVETQPEASTITYDEVGGDQSVETQPEESTISYDEVGGDQSVETQPEESTIAYD